MNKHQKGFTLIELLIVIGIIAVLIGVFVTTVNLSRPFQQARDAQRTANANSIAGSIKARIADNRGVWTVTADCPALTSVATNIIASTSGWTGPSGTGVHLQKCLVEKYMLVIPQDPSLSTASNSAGITGYKASLTNGRVTVIAPYFEGDTMPSITD